MRYRKTTVRPNASLGSEQHQEIKSSIAKAYARADSGDPSVFKTARLEKSRSGRRRTRLAIGFRCFVRAFMAAASIPCFILVSGHASRIWEVGGFLKALRDGPGERWKWLRRMRRQSWSLNARSISGWHSPISESTPL